MTSRRKDRDKRRNFNSQEMHDLGYADLQARANEDGWPYADDDGSESTEDYMTADKKRRRSRTR